MEQRGSRDTMYFDRLLEGVQIIDRDWRYVYLNDAVVAHSRRQREDHLGRKMWEVYPGIEETELFPTLRRCMEQGESAEVLNEFTFPDGNRGWYELRIQPIEGGIFILSIDVTERENALRSMETQVERLTALRNIDLAILSATDLRLPLKTVLDSAATTLGTPNAAVMLLNAETLMLEPAASSGRGMLLRLPPIRLGEEGIGAVALNRETRTFPAAELSARNQWEPAPQEASMLAVTPMVSRGLLVGVLLAACEPAQAEDQDWIRFLETLAGQAAMATSISRAMTELERSNLEIRLAYDATIEGWSRALDMRDHETEGHSERVTTITVRMAQMVGMTDNEMVHVRRGALLHDIGKMGIPDSILLKEGPLTDEEWAEMKQHPENAYHFLWPITYLRPALEIPYCHHEKWDGTGYPRGISGLQIPLSARLFAVADVFDALTSNRPYRRAWEREDALAYVRSQKGLHFEPFAVDVFVQAIDG